MLSGRHSFRFPCRAFFGAVVLFGAMLLPGQAEAQELKTAVVLPFSGPQAKKARQGVLTALMGNVQLTPAKALIQSGADPSRPDTVVAACTALTVDAVVTGKVKRRRGRRYSVVITVLDGGSGKPVAKRAATVKGKRRVHRAGLAIGRKLGGAIATCAYMPAVQEATPEPEPEVTDLPVYEPKEENNGNASKSKKKSSLAGLFEGSIGFGISRRSYELSGADPAQDRRYDGGVYPEVNLRLEVLPTAPFLDLPVDLGIGFGFAHHMSISTKLLDARNQEVSYDTGSMEIMLDLLVRWKILASRTSPVIKLNLGWGMRNFTLEANDVLPSLKYQFIRIGLDGLVPFGMTYVGLVAGFDVRPMLKAGDEAADVFGKRSGGLGWSVRGGLGGDIAFGLFYRLMFEYLAFSNDFNGRTDIPAHFTVKPVYRRDPTSASDNFIRAWLSIGYAL